MKKQQVSKKTKDFLQFNGTTIHFIDVEGVKWIAVNPICKSLKIDARRCIRNLKNDPILASEVSIQALQVGENGIIQVRNMTCVTEKYVYGWIFSLTSDSNELLEYKKDCYDLLHDHFHGVIGKRKEFLLGYTEKQLRIDEIKKIWMKDINYQEMLDLEAGKKQDIIAMKAIDKAVINQTELKFN
jgi:hypothetical protein